MTSKPDVIGRSGSGRDSSARWAAPEVVPKSIWGKCGLEKGCLRFDLSTALRDADTTSKRNPYEFLRGRIRGPKIRWLFPRATMMAEAPVIQRTRFGDRPSSGQYGLRTILTTAADGGGSRYSCQCAANEAKVQLCGWERERGQICLRTRETG